MQPIELFLDTVNDFISSSDFRKKLKLEPMAEFILPQKIVSKN